MKVVVLGFYVPPTAKVIQRRDLGLKSHLKDWRSPGSNSQPLVYKADSLTARPRRLPLNESGLVQMIRIGKSIHHVWVKRLALSIQPSRFHSY